MTCHLMCFLLSLIQPYLYVKIHSSPLLPEKWGRNSLHLFVCTIPYWSLFCLLLPHNCCSRCVKDIHIFLLLEVRYVIFFHWAENHFDESSQSNSGIQEWVLRSQTSGNGARNDKTQPAYYIMPAPSFLQSFAFCTRRIIN